MHSRGRSSVLTGSTSSAETIHYLRISSRTPGLIFQKMDAYANYFNNSVTATQAPLEFCLLVLGEFEDYDDNLWGVTSSDSQHHGYVAWGGPPPLGPVDGSIVPCAAAGSIRFMSAECIGVLRLGSPLPRNITSPSSFVDALNPMTGWYDGDALGIDLGISGILIAEAPGQFPAHGRGTTPSSD